jgi:hypothetical protein
LKVVNLALGMTEEEREIAFIPPPDAQFMQNLAGVVTDLEEAKQILDRGEFSGETYWESGWAHLAHLINKLCGGDQGRIRWLCAHFRLDYQTLFQFLVDMKERAEKPSREVESLPEWRRVGEHWYLGRYFVGGEEHQVDPHRLVEMGITPMQWAILRVQANGFVLLRAKHTMKELLIFDRTIWEGTCLKKLFQMLWETSRGDLAILRLLALFLRISDTDLAILAQNFPSEGNLIGKLL